MKMHHEVLSNVMGVFILLADAYFYRHLQKIGGVQWENGGFGGILTEKLQKMTISMF